VNASIEICDFHHLSLRPIYTAPIDGEKRRRSLDYRHSPTKQMLIEHVQRKSIITESQL